MFVSWHQHLVWSESWSPGLLHLCGLLLPTSSTLTYPAVVGLRLVGCTRLRHCEFTDWLLQYCSCWCTKDSNGQVRACVERWCARRHQHSEVWPQRRPGSDTARPTSLARRPRVTGCCSSWLWQFISVWTAAHHCTCQTTASQSPVLTLGGISMPPTVNYLQTAVPRYRLNTYGHRAFSVASSTVWNCLPDFIIDPTISQIWCIHVYLAKIHGCLDIMFIHLQFTVLGFSCILSKFKISSADEV